MENLFQQLVIDRINVLLPGSLVLKNDCNYIQGIPDLTILYYSRWALLECKDSPDSPYRPNQQYYLALYNDMGYAREIDPSNIDIVLDEMTKYLKGEYNEF